MSSNWKRTAMYLVPMIVFLIVARALLVAMACGAIFAIAAEPARDWLKRRLGKFGAVAPLLVVVATVAFVVTPLALCIAFGKADVAALTEKMTDLGNGKALKGMTRETSKVVSSLGLGIDPTFVQRQMNETLRGASAWLMEIGKASVTSGAEALLALFVFMLVFYTWLRDHRRIEEAAVRLSPLPASQSRRLLQTIRDGAVDAVLGAGLVGLAQASIALGMMLALGVPGAWLLAIVCFFFSFLPVVGTLPVTLFATLHLYLAQEQERALLMLGGAVFVAFSDNILRLIIHPKGDVSNVLKLVAILGALELLGVGGLFIGPIVAATATWAVRELLQQNTQVLDKVSPIPKASNEDDLVVRR